MVTRLYKKYFFIEYSLEQFNDHLLFAILATQLFKAMILGN